MKRKKESNVGKKKSTSKKKINRKKSVIKDFGNAFELYKTITPILDFKDALDNSIKPLENINLNLNKTIEPLSKINVNLSEHFPNLLNLKDTLIEKLKPLSEITLTLDESIKPIIEMSKNIDRSIKPLTDIGIKVDEHFPNLLNLNDALFEKLKPLSEITLTLNESVKPIIEFSNAINDQLKPLVKITSQLDENLVPISKNFLKIDEGFKPLNEISLEISEKLKPLEEISLNITQFGSEELFPAKPLVKFAQNVELVSNSVNKQLLDHTINYYHSSELETVEKPKKKSRKKKIKELIKKLEDSKTNWKKFEDVCKEIFCYCFMPELEEPLVQSFTEDKIHRRDLIFYIPHGLGGFWEFILLKFGMGIVIDCKNHADPLNGNEVRIATKYLGKKKLTTFGIIASRKGLSKNGKKIQRDLWINSDQLVICLTEEDLIKMLEIKEAGDEPWKVIDLLMKDFHNSD